MKGNALKIFFAIFVISLIMVALYIQFPPKKDVSKTTALQGANQPETLKANNMRIGIIEFDNINPILSNNKNVQDISRLIFDPLFTLTEDYQLQGVLAKECSKIEDKTYIIKLQENILWQDGREFDASDVLFTIDMLKNEDNHSVYAYNVSDIISVEELDEYTIKLILQEEKPYFAYNLIFPIVSSKYFDENNFGLESKNIKPVGTGPYYIAEAGEDKIVLKENMLRKNKQKLQLESITLCLYNSLSSTIQAFKAEEIDFFTTSHKNIEEYLKNTNYSKQSYINRNYDYLVLNCKDNVIANKEVRQAIHSAIDKEEIINEIYNNQYCLSNFPLDFGSYAYDTNNTRIAYDPNVAKRLLMDQGWKYSGNKWRKTIQYRYASIEPTLIVPKANNNLVKVANKIKEQVEKIGIRIAIKELNDGQYQDAVNHSKFDIALVSSHYSYSPSLYKYFGENNIANFESEEVTYLMDGMENTEEGNALRQSVRQIVDIYNEEVPYISLYYNTNTVIYSPHLKATVKPNSYYLFYGIENWYREYQKN